MWCALQELASDVVDKLQGTSIYLVGMMGSGKSTVGRWEPTTTASAVSCQPGTKCPTYLLHSHIGGQPSRLALGLEGIARCTALSVIDYM